MRPKTLAEVAELTARGDVFDRCLANFLDEFYLAPRAEALAAEPVLLSPTLGDNGRVQDAYLAATAEELARVYELPVPSGRRLKFAVCIVRGLRRNWRRCGRY